MQGFIRKTMLAAAVAGLMSVGAAAQSSDTGSSSTQDSSKAASSAGSSQLSAADQKFVKKAAQGGMAEVELGKLATQKASSDDVKKFGQRMVDDHTKANDQLKQIAGNKGISLPTDLDAKDQALKDRLSKLDGEQFDRAYMKNMVRDHTKDVSEFRKESTSAKDNDLKNFASQTLPTLEDHLKEAKNIAPKGDKQAMKEKEKPAAGQTSQQ
jgi:putative membrane protein